MAFEVRRYLTRSGADPFSEWYAALRDRQAQARVQARLDRQRTSGRQRSTGMTISKGRKRKARVPPSVPHRPYLLKWLKDPENAAAYIDAVLEDGDEAALLHALRNVADARGGIARIAAKTGLNREALYRTLSKRGNPQLKSFAAILEATGLRLSVTPAGR
jgi:probable addiction module antidote protein